MERRDDGEEEAQGKSGMNRHSSYFIGEQQEQARLGNGWGARRYIKKEAGGIALLGGPVCLPRGSTGRKRGNQSSTKDPAVGTVVCFTEGEEG